MKDGLDPVQHLEEQLFAHVSRGIHLLWTRAKNLDNLAPLVEKAHKKAALYETVAEGEDG